MRRARAQHLNRLWIARKKAGLPQKAVARLLGYRSTSPISEYETGRLLPNLRTAFKLAIIYNTPLPGLYAPLYQDVAGELESIRQKLPVLKRRRDGASAI
jgi:transcriptional regulator with XRE-family HTH domain